MQPKGYINSLTLQKGEKMTEISPRAKQAPCYSNKMQEVSGLSLRAFWTFHLSNRQEDKVTSFHRAKPTPTKSQRVWTPAIHWAVKIHAKTRKPKIEKDINTSPHPKQQALGAKSKNIETTKTKKQRYNQTNSSTYSTTKDKAQSK